jgi:hypothetical protein
VQVALHFVQPSSVHVRVPLVPHSALQGEVVSLIITLPSTSLSCDGEVACKKQLGVSLFALQLGSGLPPATAAWLSV